MLTRRGATRDSRIARKSLRAASERERLLPKNRPALDRAHGLLMVCRMPTATKTATLPKDAHDAPRSTQSTREEIAVRERQVRQVEPEDVTLDDSYDNIACTD
jgi:hypothetical protein